MTLLTRTLVFDLTSLTRSDWFILVNAFAAFFAAVLWMAFAWTRLRNRQWSRAFPDVILAVSSLIVGAAYIAWMIDGPYFALFRWVQLVAVPLLFIPPTLILRFFRRASKTVEDLREHEKQSRQIYEDDRDGRVRQQEDRDQEGGEK